MYVLNDKLFPESIIREEQYGRLEYFVPAEDVTWAQLFAILERNKENLNIEDYSVTQTTLERVSFIFLS